MEAGDIFAEVATTITKLNYKELPEIVNLCRNLGVDWFMHYNFIPVGRGTEIVNLDLDPLERENMIRYLWHELRSDDSMALLSTAPQFARIAIQEGHGASTVIPSHFYNCNLPGQLQNLSSFVGGCGAGRFYCAIRPNGNIEPCVFLSITVGNIKQDDFEDLWVNNRIFRTLRDRTKLQGNCGTCQYNTVCGGCRARAYAYFGDITAPDPGCINNNVVYNVAITELLQKAQISQHKPLCVA